MCYGCLTWVSYVQPSPLSNWELAVGEHPERDSLWKKGPGETAFTCYYLRYMYLIRPANTIFAQIQPLLIIFA